MNESNKKRRRGFVTWRDLPDFCDASASVSASTFGARRLPEVRALYYSTTATTATTAKTKKLEDTLSSGGCKTSSRHLRRRATSHASRKRHRQSTHISTRTCLDWSQTNSCVMKPESDNDITGSRPSRRKRRKRITLRQEHESWNNIVLDVAAAQGGTPSSTIKVQNLNWIPTHLWNVKRFSVETLWGWKVPILHSNRGAKAALRLVREGKCLVQDATWTKQPICLEIPFDQQVQSSLMASMSRIIPGFRVDDLSEIANGRRTVRVFEGVMHHMDWFPLRAIGPVQWLVSPHPLFLAPPSPPTTTPTCSSDDSTIKNNSDQHHLYVYVWTHVSIQREATECIQEWVRGSQLGGSLSSSCSTSSIKARSFLPAGGGGMSCLRLRGRAAVTCLQRAWSSLLALQAGEQSGNATNNDDNNNRLDELSLLLSDDGDSLMSEKNHGKLMSFTISVEEDSNRLSSSNDAVTSKEGATSQRAFCALVQCPRDPSQSCNWGSIGLDLWCQPTSLASKIWLALILHGGACPIGLVEEVQLALEASPPLPVFPRDFPDTTAGVEYWTGTSTSTKSSSNPIDYWSTYRSCLEAGTGRISVKPDNKQLRKVEWVSFVSESGRGESTGAGTAVVRGSFGEPFLKLLESAKPHNAGASPSQQPRLRNQRRRRAPSELVQMPPQPKDRVAEHQTICQSLLHSLSLPALILCHVIISGKGSFVPGTIVYDRDSRPLGSVTAGAFSCSRGSFHGLAACGAARLLQAMMSASTSAKNGSFVLASCRRGQQGDGTQQPTCRLAVLVGTNNSNDKTKRHGSISLLF